MAGFPRLVGLAGLPESRGQAGEAGLAGQAGLAGCWIGSFWVPKVAIWEAWRHHCDTLGHHFGSLWHHCGTQGHPTGHLGAQMSIFIDFKWILGPSLGPLWGHFGDFFVF